MKVNPESLQNGTTSKLRNLAKVASSQKVLSGMALFLGYLWQQNIRINLLNLVLIHLYSFFTHSCGPPQTCLFSCLYSNKSVSSQMSAYLLPKMKGSPAPQLREKSQRAGFKTQMNKQIKGDNGNLRSNKYRGVSCKFLF